MGNDTRDSSPTEASRDGGGTNQSPEATGYESREAANHYASEVTPKGLTDVEEHIVEEYFCENGADVLDVGCGTGRTTKPLAERGFDVVGVDHSEHMIAAATDLYPTVEFQVGDVADLSFTADSFDYVLFSYCGIDSLRPESVRVEALSEIQRVLRPNGVAVFSSHNWLYVIPALVSDFTHLWKYYLTNRNLRRLGSSYKRDPVEFDVEMYWGTPWQTRAQLQTAGLELVDWITKRDTPLKYLEVAHHYVVQPASDT